MLLKEISMADEVLFSERQKFKQWWVWVLLAGINAIFLSGVFRQVIKGQKWGDKPISNSALLLTTASIILLTILISIIRLDTQIKEDGIYVKFFPLHLSFRRYTWDQLSRSFVRRYNPIGEYGGWGIRFGLFGKGKAFNVSGDIGLQLEFWNKRKLLIGTNKSDELTKALDQLGQNRP